MPEFVLLLRDQSAAFPNMAPEQMQAIIQRYVAWRARVQHGRTITGHKLRDNEGRVVNGQGSRLKVSDGPFAEANEVMGGLFVIEAANYDEVVELCKDCPHLEFGSIEIREIEPTPGEP